VTSALYRGHLMHARRDAHARRFRYPCVTACLDLDELDALDARLRLFSYNRANLWSLHDRDYDPPSTIAAAHRARLAAAGLPQPARTLLVTQLRTANWVFNPVSFFLGYDAAGALASVVADVRNNYGGRHQYLLGPGQRVDDLAGRVRYRVDKEFFVSPFLHGPARYDFGFGSLAGGAPLDIRMDVHRPDGDRVFLAHLTGAPVALTDRALLAAALRYPLMSVQVIALIYGEALWAHARRVPFRRPGPDHRPT
jgi:DUF1365 family protein